MNGQDYIQIGTAALPLIIESAKVIKEIMEKEGLDIDQTIAMLEMSRDILPDLDFGGETGL